MHLDNAREFHSKSTVAVPEVRASLHDAGASRIMLSIQLSKNDSSPPSEKKPFCIIPDAVAPRVPKSSPRFHKPTDNINSSSNAPIAPVCKPRGQHSRHDNALEYQ